MDGFGDNDCQLLTTIDTKLYNQSSVLTESISENVTSNDDGDNDDDDGE